MVLGLLERAVLILLELFVMVLKFKFTSVTPTYLHDLGLWQGSLF